MYLLRSLYYCVFISIGLSFARRLISWTARIRTFRKSMPTIPILFQPDSPFRHLWPKRWQTFHRGWSMQYKRIIYQKIGSDIFALVCLFDSDKVYFTDPYAVIDVKVTKAEGFGRDMLIFSRVSHLKRAETYKGRWLFMGKISYQQKGMNGDFIGESLHGRFRRRTYNSFTPRQANKLPK